jgi:hypothetical protein
MAEVLYKRVVPLGRHLLLGAKPIDTGGPGFAAILRPEYQF